MAREIVRHIQEARKKAGLEMEDRIELNWASESDKLRQAITEHRDFIAGEHRRRNGCPRRSATMPIGSPQAWTANRCKSRFGRRRLFEPAHANRASIEYLRAQQQQQWVKTQKIAGQ